MVLYNKLLKFSSEHKQWLGFFVIGLVLLIPTLVMFFPLSAQADVGFVAWFAKNIILGIANFLGSLTITVIGILVSIVQYNDFIYAPAVEKGWIVTRDVANMFVIVVMMLTAFGTVFRLEEYQWKHTLSKILIMSVLVNFSKMLTGFMIDAGQVVMLTFVNGFKEAAAGNFINGFHLKDVFEISQNQGDNSGLSSDSDFFWASILALISVSISLIVVVVYLVVFIVRIAFLWILVVVSPLAYILKVFPGSAEKKYAEEFFDYLGKYITAGPILAFFLWMSLAVMQISGDASSAGLNIVNTGDTGGLSGVPAATITKIGQSDVLLSFMINITMLIGGLWMTSKLGVVGGGLAKSALSKIENVGSSIAKAPFKLAGAAVKGGGGFLWKEATARLGIESSWEKWKEGWHAGTHRRELVRRQKLQAVYGKRMEKGKFSQVFGSPEHLFEHLWNTKTLGKILTGKHREVTGKKAYNLRNEATAKEKEIEEMENNAPEDIGLTYRNSLETELAQIDKDSSGLDTQIKSIDEGSDVDAVKKRAVSLRTQGVKQYNEGEYEEGQEKIDEADKLEKEAAQMELTKEDRKKAAEGQKVAMEARKQEINTKLSDSSFDWHLAAKDKLSADVNKLEDDANNLENGPVSDQHMKERQEGIDKLVKEIQALKNTLQSKRAMLEKEGKTPTEIESELKSDNDLLTSKLGELSKLNSRDNDSKSEKEIKEDKKQADKLRERAAFIKAKIEAKPISFSEREGINKKVEALKKEVKDLYYQAAKTSPAVDYGMRREQRLAINKEMSEMTTDNWQELAKIFEDAVHVGDGTRAAAAYLKATKYGNENEFQNWFGYDSDAGGMKKFMEHNFIHHLGMDEQQVMSIANDASYIGEGVNHWGVARAVRSDRGKLEWANEDDRMVEVLAEVRKKDFEGFMRQANRLAYGKEVVGLGELADDATTQERAEYFRKGGGRGFKLNDFGQAYIAENAGKFKRLLDTGRFNVNLAVNFGSGDNLKKTLGSAVNSGAISGNEIPGFERMLDRVKEFGTGTRGQFDDIMAIIKHNKT